MTTEARRPPEGPPAELFRAFFESLEQPAALCDLELRPLACNAAFARFCAEQGATVEGLMAALAGAQAPSDGAC
ncbi:MAG TPA: histidine kinase, partial [Archangium sp.]